MDEQQEVQQQEVQQPQIDVDELRAAIDAALQTQNDAITSISGDVQQMRLVLERSGEEEQEEESLEEVVYTVHVDNDQIAVAKSAVQTISTLCLVLIIAVSIMCGLQLWSIFSRSWSHV